MSYITKKNASTNYFDLVGLKMRAHSLPGYRYLVDDHEESILPSSPTTNTDGAPVQGIMDHWRTIARKVWFVSIF